MHGRDLCIHAYISEPTFFLNRSTRFICAATFRGGSSAAGGVVGDLFAVLGEVVVEGRLWIGEMVRSVEAVVAVSLGVVGGSDVVGGRSLCHARMCSSSRRARRRYSLSSRA